MYHPSRGGVRGGRDQFNWEDVKGDKHRESYVGHSIKAPVGRWQKGKDLHWYTKDKSNLLALEATKAEIEKIKLEEEQAMREALGLAPKNLTRPSGSHLDKQEVAELFKRGKITEDLANTYAMGERVQGFGFTPAPGQRGNTKIPVEVKSEAEDALVQLGNLEGVGNSRESAKTANAGVDKPSSTEDNEASRRKRKEERRAARELRKQERSAKKLARKEEKARHSKQERETSLVSHKHYENRCRKRPRQENSNSDDQQVRKTDTSHHGRRHKHGSESHSSVEAKKEKRAFRKKRERSISIERAHL